MSTNNPNNNNLGFIPNNVHNLLPNNNNNNSQGVDPNQQFANLLFAFQQQQQQQQPQQQQQQILNTSNNNNISNPLAASLEPTPINQLGLLNNPTLSVQQQQTQFTTTTTTTPTLAAGAAPQQKQQMIANNNMRTTGTTIFNNNNSNSSQPFLKVPATIAAPTTTAAAKRKRPGTVFGRGMTERQQFLVFVKILLQYIERTNNPNLRRTTKAIVAECTRRNRMGDAAYMPLQDAVERRLRRSLGEVHWARARQSFESYVARQNIRTVQAATIQAV